MLTPARRNTPELLDDPATGAAVAAVSGEDIARCNRWLGGSAALRAQCAPLWPLLPPRITLLDVASGVGDLAAELVQAGRLRGIVVDAIALDRRAELGARARARGAAALCADAAHLPVATASVDVVICCQFLHHLDPAAIIRLAAECSRIARYAVLVADLRRSWIAAAGLWLAAHPLRLHPVSRHDGVASVLKGFTRPELSALLTAAAGHPVPVQRRAPFRLTAAWGPAFP